MWDCERTVQAGLCSAARGDSWSKVLQTAVFENVISQVKRNVQVRSVFTMENSLVAFVRTLWFLKQCSCEHHIDRGLL